MSTMYDYIPVSCLPDDTVRLLELCPGQHDEKIRCILSTAQLTLRPEFAALSYVWGTEPASKEIELNGKQFWIRKNLWQCLVRFRDPTVPLTIWIDAICVNQEDISERNQQVKLMHHIFGTAKPVFAWLSEELGMTISHIYPTFKEDLPSFSFPRLERVAEESDEQSTDVPSVDNLKLQVCRAITELCKSEYWNRIWIVQEILVAQELLLCFAHLQVSWEDFKSWCNHLLGIQMIEAGHLTRKVIRECCSEIINGGLESFLLSTRDDSIDRSHMIHPAPAPEDLDQLILKYGHKKCSDSRDKVYALLGLRKYRYVHHLRDQPQLQADYGRSNADLFLDVVMFEGILQIPFAGHLRYVLNVGHHDLERAARSRREDAYFANMKLEATVRGVLFTKLEDVSGSKRLSYAQVVLVVREDNEEYQAVSLRSLEQGEKVYREVLLGFATGDQVVKSGDFVFILQHSPMLLIFRYQRSCFRLIARLERFMPHPDEARHQPCDPELYVPRAATILLSDVYAPGIDFEIWNGIQTLKFGPEVLLEVMKHGIYYGDYNFDDWLGA